MSDPRERLASRQADLVRALVAGGEAPGFDARQVRLTARSLVNKRVRETARAWPALGEALLERFRAYAERTPPPGEGGPLADGRAFLRTLPPGEATDELRRSALAVDLAYRSSPAGLRPRRGICFKLARLRPAPGFLLGVRLPWLGLYIVSLP